MKCREIICSTQMDKLTSTHDIVRRVKDGDRDAFSDLFAKYRNRLAVVVHFRLGQDLRRFVDVDDVLQEALLEAYKDIEKFEYRGPGAFMNWLARIADHVIADLARSQGRAKRAAEVVRFRSEGNPEGPEPVDSITPSRIFRENEELAQLIAKLNKLPEDYRIAIVLAKIEGVTTRELAERLGKSSEAAALLLHRAIKRFRTLNEASKEN
ncbi:MAG: RNA polymerase sigma factor [Blastocatellia bacterium]